MPAESMEFLGYFAWTIVRGDSLTYLVSFYNRDGSPLNLSGWAVYFAARNKVTGRTIIKGMSVVEPQNGKCLLTITPSDFEEAGIYDAEFEARSDQGEIVTLSQGIITVRDDIKK